MLATLPLKTLTELGFTIAFGVLLDTFIVRSVLVPSLVLDIGPRVWWPSALTRNAQAPYRQGAAEIEDHTDGQPPRKPTAVATSQAPDGSTQVLGNDRTECPDVV